MSAAETGSLNRKPWPSGQPSVRSASTWTAPSTPSATTAMSMVAARSWIVRMRASGRGPCDTSSTNVLATLRMSTGAQRRYSSEE